MHRTIAGIITIVINLLVLATVAAAQGKDVFVVMGELERLSRQELWPGFDPLSYPLAIYDGSRTWLFQHADPPEEFAISAQHPGVSMVAGRHPAMRWNSNAEIGGMTTATLLLTIDPERSVAEEAALIIHETFHIFQRRQGWPWRPNELHKFTYPVTDVINYRLSIEEDHALARAMQEDSTALAAGWAARAMMVRRERFLRLSEEHRDFEHGIEVKEGLAFYLAHKVVGDHAGTVKKLLESLPPNEFRWRPYATGGAIAALLDRLAPTWRDRFDTAPELTLDGLLTEAVEHSQTTPRAFTQAERDKFHQQASASVDELQQQLARYRRLFSPDDNHGWPEVRHLVSVEILDRPYALQAWDPITILSLGNNEVLHGKKLTLGCPAGSIKMVNPGFKRRQFVGLNALTRVRIGHPIVGEIVQVVFAGLSERPQVLQRDGRVTVTADGLEIDLIGASIATTKNLITLTVDPS